MTAQQRKARKFAEALEEFDRFKKEFREKNPDATPEEYHEAMSKKAIELDL